MEIIDKINALGEAAKYDVCLSSCLDKGRKRDPHDPHYRWIYPASLPNGRTAPILKILMGNQCENNCLYCLNRAEREHRDISFTPEELARVFMELVQKHKVHGLFLSSAVKQGPNYTMEKMIKAAEIIRVKQRYKGYIHLKVLPGVDYSYVERAAELATRLSLNLEAPTSRSLARIAPDKDLKDDIIKRMIWIRDIIKRQGKGMCRNQTTQFVVGASEESDKEILDTTDWLYRNIHLYRAYFSAFQPVEDTPLEGHPPTPLLREHRLYQVDFLVRLYGFSFKEMVLGPKENLLLETDPKIAWAKNNPQFFPLEVNRADRFELLRIPGIGPKSADRIIKRRRENRFSSLEELKGTGAIAGRAAPFILIKGKIQSSGHQLQIKYPAPFSI